MEFLNRKVKRMKKKIFSLGLVVCLFAVVAGSTAAYFTTSETAHNIVTTHKVDIAISETTIVTDENGKIEEVPFGSVTFDNVMPTATVSKIVKVQMPQDSAGAWVRVKIEKNVTLADKTEGNTDYMILDINHDDWLLGTDGWYYYKNPMKAEDATTPIFEEVQFSYRMDNSHQNATANVIITAQAVQTANNGATIWEAQGWPSAEE